MDLSGLEADLVDRDETGSETFAAFSVLEVQRISEVVRPAPIPVLTDPVPVRPQPSPEVIIPPYISPRQRRISWLIRLAAILSITIHAALLAGAFLDLSNTDDMSAGGESVSVEIIPTSSFSSNSTESVESDAAEDLVSAGAEPVEAIESETLEPTEATEMTEPVETVTPEPETLPTETAELAEPVTASVAPAEPVEPIETPETPVEAEPLLAAAMETVVPDMEAAAPVPVEPVTEETPPETAQAVQPETPPETIEPVPEGPVAPVPQTRTVAQRTDPTYPQRPTRPRQQPTQAPTQAQQQPQRREASSGGNGGQADADQVASRAAASAGGGGGGGSAATNKYPGQILSRLRRALRYPPAARNARGEVQVRFTVSAGGAVSGISVVSSSGNPILDEAAIATVQRAAPFPPIPPEAGKNNWTFTMPLGFVR